MFESGRGVISPLNIRAIFLKPSYFIQPAYVCIGRGPRKVKAMGFKILLIKLSLAMGVALPTLFGCGALDRQTTLPTINGNSSEPITQNHIQSNAYGKDLKNPEQFFEIEAVKYESLGDIYFEKNNLHKAFLQYEKSLKLQPDNISVLYKKALCLAAGRRNEEAVKEFKALIKKKPDYALAYQGLGRAYFQTEEYEEAEIHFRKALGLDSTLWKAHNFLGIIYDRQKKQGNAVKAYNAAIALIPRNGLLYNNLGVSFYKAGAFDKAVEAFNKAVENGYTDDKVHNNLGLALSKAGRYRNAWEAFRQAGDEPAAFNNLGCGLLEQGAYDKAIRCFERAIKINPKLYPIASENLQKARMAQGA